ncbi:hypothetical protein NDU88_000289 [Pleurodeles waltl]|uniref:Uncharacterized protein n=1 Tax=Pleurodeles waltl TaxID=8319 RepID=A0AAV7MHA6_PLEWA|nr:hypothetical protein NDU88_000289 [Pleurodeles waltl]
MTRCTCCREPPGLFYTLLPLQGARAGLRGPDIKSKVGAAESRLHMCTNYCVHVVISADRGEGLKLHWRQVGSDRKKKRRNELTLRSTHPQRTTAPSPVPFLFFFLAGCKARCAARLRPHTPKAHDTQHGRKVVTYRVQGICVLGAGAWDCLPGRARSAEPIRPMPVRNSALQPQATVKR